MAILPAEMLESQLSIIDLLIAMFPSPSEHEIPESTREAIDKLHDWCENPTETPTGIPPSLSLAVYLEVAAEKTIQVNISMSLQPDNPEIQEPPPLNYSLRQPEWMSKAELAKMTAAMPSDDVFMAFEYIREEATRLLETRETLTTTAAIHSSGPLVRVWFYFPSLSTRGKRDDLVNYASDYSLTGFVLAGKPGVLCLEGASTDIDAYMSFIKTNSWGDIPSHQKKVSERFRETGDIQRVFAGMEEITDSLGQRGGQRANRGDMQALEAWLTARDPHFLAYSHFRPISLFTTKTKIATGTYTLQASALRRHGHVVIDGRACQILQVLILDNKYHLEVKDLFLGNEFKTTIHQDDNVEAPEVRRDEYSLENIDEEMLNLMTPDGTPKDDIRIPDNDLGTQIKKDFEDGKDCVVDVISAMGEEQAISVKEKTKGHW